MNGVKGMSHDCLIRLKKLFHKTQHPFIMKVMGWLRMEGTYLSIINVIMTNIDNNILNENSLINSKIQSKTRNLPYIVFFNPVHELLPRAK